MKKLIAMAAAIVFALGANAQIGKGEVVLGASVGVGNTVYSGDDYTSKLIPLNLDVEVGVAENLFDVESLSLGVGALASYTQAKVDWSLGTSRPAGETMPPSSAPRVPSTTTSVWRSSTPT